MQFRKQLALAALMVGIAVAQAPNLSGTWKLNAQKSSWGKKPKPVNVIVTVEHNEPQFKYSGTVTDANGNPSNFAVECPIDGQEHPVTTSYGPGKIAIKRLNPYTTESTYKSDDGKYTETATTSVSRDGKEMTRRLHSKGPDGDATWTEVYDRQ